MLLACSMEDGILAHDFYQRAARGSVECYLALLDKPKEEQDESGPDYSGMTAAEKKREKVGVVGPESKDQRGREHAHCRRLAADLFGYYWVFAVQAKARKAAKKLEAAAEEEKQRKEQEQQNSSQHAPGPYRPPAVTLLPRAFRAELSASHGCALLQTRTVMRRVVGHGKSALTVRPPLTTTPMERSSRPRSVSPSVRRVPVDLPTRSAADVQALNAG